MPTTGKSIIDLGEQLSYNGMVFSVLYKTTLNGQYLPNNAKTTIKAVEYTLEAEGIVIPSDGQNTIDMNMADLRLYLARPGGQLKYLNRGFNQMVVNPVGGGGTRDVAWGPIPKVILFQPLGNGLSAMVKWQCTFTIPEFATILSENPLQFTYSYDIAYNDKFYSRLTFKGILEVPLTRTAVFTRTLPANAVDTFRQEWLNLTCDLTKFRVADRTFNESEDRRTCEWQYVLEELPPMDLPPGCPKATGAFDVQQVKMGQSKTPLLLGVTWSCHLRATYIVRKNFSRNQAYLEFQNLMLYRMARAALPGVGYPETTTVTVNTNTPEIQTANLLLRALNPLGPQIPTVNITRQVATGRRKQGQALLTDFRFSEGLYLDSDATTFEASWLLLCDFPTLLIGSGIWSAPADGGRYIAGGADRQRWAASISDASGWKSWLKNQFNPASAVIVDFGGGNPGGVQA